MFVNVAERENSAATCHRGWKSVNVQRIAIGSIYRTTQGKAKYNEYTSK